MQGQKRPFVNLAGKIEVFGKKGRSETGVQLLRSKCAVMNFP